MQRESMTFDVVIVGAGPAGLSAAIRLKQLAQQQQRQLEICVVEKAAEIGGHILSGAVFEPRALDELLPDWKTQNAPITIPVQQEEFLFLSKNKSWRLPNSLLIPQQRNHGCYVVSLGNVCRWLASQAEALGVQIFPGFAASQLIFGEYGQVCGVITDDKGLDKSGTPKASLQPGYELRAHYTLLAEGCHGHLGKQVIARYQLRQDCDPQHYALGFKELWEIPAENHQAGFVNHATGWPLDNSTYGGSFLYHLEAPYVIVGFAIGLDYRNPHLNLYEEFQRLKTHSSIRSHLKGGRRIAYGARALNEGGYQSVPKLSFPGGLLIGCDAGFVNIAKIKGSHNAMKSGMLAAEVVAQALTENRLNEDLHEYQTAYAHSWIHEELHRARNIYPAFHYLGRVGGILFTGLDQLLLRGKLPFTWHVKTPDHASLVGAKHSAPIDYPKPDGVVSFDLMSSVYLSNTNHEEDQPCHLQLRDTDMPIRHNLERFDEPAQRYCPAGVYEIIRDNNGAHPHLHINAQNCIHCKTCDIKDPAQNITWVPPEGGGGPNYPNM